MKTSRQQITVNKIVEDIINSGGTHHKKSLQSFIKHLEPVMTAKRITEYMTNAIDTYENTQGTIMQIHKTNIFAFIGRQNKPYSSIY